jgi:hypothetical protein
MINSEEKFFSYLKGKMNSEEKKEFEDELIRSDNLNKEYTEYEKLNNIIDETKNIHLSKDYSESIITDFRKRIESEDLKRSYPMIRYAIASIIIFIVGYFLISQLNKENPDEIKSLLTDFSEAELNSFSNNYYYSTDIANNIDDAVFIRIDSIYTENLSESLVESIGKKSLEDILSLSDVANVDEYLSDIEVDIIYAQLINKEIL